MSNMGWAQEAISKEKTVAVPMSPVVVVSPSNSSISFIGIHVGNDPKPRLGGFNEFRGFVEVDPKTKKVSSVLLHIQVDSIWTEFSKLTTHLKNADFFETSKFPVATFQSTKITAQGDSKIEIAGNLTLHGETKPFRFFAQTGIDSSGMTLKGQFKLDRSMFGMNQMLSGVDKMVSVEFSVGQKTKGADKVSDGHGGDSKKKTSVKKLKQVLIHVPNMT